MSTRISSRTPEGEPNSCPICHNLICIEPSQPSGDAPCPNCGTLLWFLKADEGVRYHESDKMAPIRKKLLEVIAARLGAAGEPVSEGTSLQGNAGMDSLDIVELVMELEEEFRVVIPDEEAERIKTVGEAMDYLARHMRHYT